MSSTGFPIVAIVGRPNVGKSTLFNRLVGQRRAIVHATAGTTRDRLYADAEWQGHTITLVDTGGLAPLESDSMAGAVNAQVDEAVEQADLILFAVDSTTGLAPADRTIADRLRRAGKPVQVVVTKADNPAREAERIELWALGFGEPVAVSAQHGRGTGDLLDILADRLDWTKGAPARPDMPHLAVVGRPNVGKSTLFNRLAGQDHRITSDQPNTTRDLGRLRIDTASGPLVLLDTAGVRRRGQSGRGLTKYSLLRTLRGIQESDAVALVIDASEGPTLQDAHIASYVLEAGKSLIVVVNKWDLVEKTNDVQERFLGQLQQRLGWLPSPPVVFISALTGEKTDRIGRAVQDVYQAGGMKIPTPDLNRVVRANLDKLPGGAGRRAAKLYYLTQTGTRPPTFTVFVNKTAAWGANHRRYLMNVLRRHYQLPGTPVKLRFREKKPSDPVAS